MKSAWVSPKNEAFPVPQRQLISGFPQEEWSRSPCVAQEVIHLHFEVVVAQESFFALEPSLSQEIPRISASTMAKVLRVASFFVIKMNYEVCKLTIEAIDNLK